MSIANLQEKLLFFTRQKSNISKRLSDVQMKQLHASQQVQEKQQLFNQKLSSLYYEYYAEQPDVYSELYLELTNDHEFELANINSWESQLELQKETLETQLNEITAFENAWMKLLSQNIKVEFSYGGGGK